MERKRWVYDEMGEIKKGPWKAEEDEVLINHVKKYGPRDWSSIRSKGLLYRTGKSCRLRWVNKLRPNLKNGVKFSADEERVVIELQAEFGNKWARIATYLPGRTDNDVKNYWSSRQKRLARILQTPSSSTTPTNSHHKNSTGIGELRSLHDVAAIELLQQPKFSSLVEEEPWLKTNSCSSSSYIENPNPVRMVQLPELVNPNFLVYEQNLLQLEITPIEKKPNIDDHLQLPPLSTFSQLEADIPLGLGSQELATQLGDPNFVDVFGQVDSSDILPLPYVSQVDINGVERRYGGSGEIEKLVTPESFVEDFPVDDIFDMIPSPSNW